MKWRSSAVANEETKIVCRYCHVYLENPQTSNEKQSDLIREFNKVAAYEMQNKQTEK